jgi:hypothetical protein
MLRLSFFAGEELSVVAAQIMKNTIYIIALVHNLIYTGVREAVENSKLRQLKREEFALIRYITQKTSLLFIC